ncbi:MAG: alpha/beta hydrolase-fold protein [Muribaculaceae bacterium]|nr:alpha/beta hydrolase-fold protein [Muribaculaceae bacterium]
MDILSDWITPTAIKYGVSIVVITGMDWQNVFSPWPAKGVPRGCPPFKGESSAFLHTLQQDVIPQIEQVLGVSQTPERTLFGVSMSGLFALWQWIVCDTFLNIASLSGSFWYDGFMEWINAQPIPPKPGKAFLLLGDTETQTNVQAFKSVGVNTQAIISLLRGHNIRVQFESVPGNHYADPIPRLNKAFQAIYS